MRSSTVAWLQCPNACQAPLDLSAARCEGEDVVSGELACAECGGRYPIEEGIARMLPAQLAGAADAAVPAPDAARQRREMQARDEQVGDYDRMWYLNLFGAVEVPLTLRHLRLDPGHRLLEAGCGTGRMSPRFASRCADMVALDFSWESLRVCSGKLRAAGARHVDLVQGDLCHLPFRPGAFDRVVSCQVLEHIPSAESRSAAVQELARVLRAGGNLALSAYKYSLWMRLMGSKEGEHAGGIPFYRFERAELRQLLSRALHVRGMTGVLVYHYIARCEKA